MDIIKLKVKNCLKRLSYKTLTPEFTVNYDGGAYFLSSTGMFNFLVFVHTIDMVLNITFSMIYEPKFKVGHNKYIISGKYDKMIKCDGYYLMIYTLKNFTYSKFINKKFYHYDYLKKMYYFNCRMNFSKTLDYIKLFSFNNCILLGGLIALKEYATVGYSNFPITTFQSGIELLHTDFPN